AIGREDFGLEIGERLEIGRVPGAEANFQGGLFEGGRTHHYKYPYARGAAQGARIGAWTV
ncbi:MAG: hypothetical protein J2P54_18540, partial [Bradyrhizobiaceae bacterium]|nr:hypothetical protein [Bradyrhizobiaceae bacterium]